MRVFTVHVAPPGRTSGTRLLPEGFSFWGFLLGPVWLLVNGAWPFALAAVAMLVLLPWPVWLGVAALTGVCGQDARRVMLAWRGWGMTGIVAGVSEDQAEIRWFDRGSAPLGGAG